jgi:hypothetical protein
LKKSQLSKLILIVGVILSAAIGFVSYLWSKPEDAAGGIILGLIGTAITLALEARVKLTDLEDTIRDGTKNLGKIIEEKLRDFDLEWKILSRGFDDVFSAKHRELKEEIRQLALGRYRLHSLLDVYKDDISSMRALSKGERLLSMCPIATTSKEEIVKQITNPYYKASIEEHTACVTRGVEVVRIYQLRDKESFTPELKSHLSNLAKKGIDIRVVLRDETDLHTDIDIVVFGTKKASVGIIDVDTGVCCGANVETDPRTVEKYIREYSMIEKVAQRFQDFER